MNSSNIGHRRPGAFSSRPTSSSYQRNPSDSIGSDGFNQKLSEQRAASVVSFLLGQGVAADKLSSEGRGESEPVDSNDTDAGRAKNRRVEIHLSH